MRTGSLIIAAATAALAAGCSCGGPGATANTAPSARIISPLDGAALAGQGPFLLVGEATDAEEGPLGDSALQWSSDLDGVLGTGAMLHASLRSGRHRLTLDATDSGGLVGRAQITVTISSENRPPTVSIDDPADGAYVDEGATLSLRGHASDPEDGTLAGAALTWTSDKAGLLGRGTEVSLTASILGEHRIVLTAVDSGGLSAYASVRVTVVRPGTNRPPTVTIQNPANNAAVTLGATVSLEGSATDPEDGPLTGASLSWSSSRDGPLGAGSPLAVTTLQLGVHTLTLTATDRQAASAQASVTIAVNSPQNAAPTASIGAPPNGHTTYQGTAITFAGSATDPEDGPLSGTALAWTSSLDGALGTGGSLTTSALSAGTHQITLTATDSGGNSGVASIQVVVLPQNQPPGVTITSPATGSSVTAGTTVQLRGSAQDPEDGALTGSSLTWQSSLDGVLGTGTSVDTAALQVGQHQLSLNAVDSGGRSGAATVTLTVQPAPVKLPPVARLSGPAQGETGQALGFSGASSSDSDGTIVAYRFDFGDGTPAVEGAAAAVSHTYTAPGSYTVSLLVRDNDALTGSDSMQVAITVAVRRPVVLEQRTERLGSTCRIGAQAGAIQVAFRAEDHPSIWFGVKSAGGWSAELVDGMGFTVGGRAEPRFAMAVDAAGAPHLAYFLAGRGVWYATRTASGWMRERVDTTIPSTSTDRISIALDPAQADRPTIAYGADGASGYARVALAFRTGPGAWSQSTLTFGSTSYDQRLAGDILIDDGGTVYVPYTHSSAYYAHLGTWNGTAAAHLNLNPSSATPGFPTWAATSWRSAGKLLLLTGAGVLEVELQSPLSSSTAQLSLVETFSTKQHAITTSATGQPRVVVNHGSELELVTPDAEGYWLRESLGATDDAVIDATVDAQGDTRVCFFRAGKLMLY